MQTGIELIAQERRTTYRYDGVDEYGQHWLERVEIDEDGSEIFTEDYIPIRLHARKAEAIEDVMPDRWMKDAAEEISDKIKIKERDEGGCLELIRVGRDLKFNLLFY